MVTRRLEFSKAATRDVKKLTAAGLKLKAQEPLDVLRHNSWQNSLPYQKLVCELASAHSRSIRRQHRLVYRVNEDTMESISSACGHDTNKTGAQPNNNGRKQLLNT